MSDQQPRQGLGERLAVVEARQERAVEDIAEMKKDIRSILSVLHQAQGGWRVYVALGSVASVIAAAGTAAVMKVLHIIPAGLPPK